MPLIVQDPISVRLENQRQMAQNVTTGFQMGARLGEVATQARLTLRAQMVQEQQFVQTMDMRRDENAVQEAHLNRQFEVYKAHSALQATALQQQIAEDRTLSPLRALELQNRVAQQLADADQQALLLRMGPAIRQSIQADVIARKRGLDRGDATVGWDNLNRLLSKKGAESLAMDKSVLAAQAGAEDEIARYIQQGMSPESKKLLSASIMDEQANTAATPEQAAQLREAAANVRASLKPKIGTDPVSQALAIQELEQTNPKAAELAKELGKKGMSVTTNPDGTMTLTTGSMLPQAPVSVKAKAMTDALGGATTSELIDKTLPDIDVGTVGLGGTFGRLIDSTFIGDLAPGLFSEKRVQVRNKLTAIASQVTKLMRTDVGNMSEPERQQIQQAIPRLAAAQSANEVRTQLMSIRSLIGTGKRKALRAAGLAIPQEYWTKDEIVDYVNKQKDAGNITREEAVQQLNDMLFKSLVPNEYNQNANLISRYGQR